MGSCYSYPIYAENRMTNTLIHNSDNKQSQKVSFSNQVIKNNSEKVGPVSEEYSEVECFNDNDDITEMHKYK